MAKNSIFEAMKLMFVVFGILLSFGLAAQTLNEDEVLEKASTARAAYNLKNEKINGFRVQLVITSKRQDAIDIQQKLEQQYPLMSVYLIFDSPNFKIRVGDYAKKIEALDVYSRLKSEYPAAFLVNDKVLLQQKLGCQ